MSNPREPSTAVATRAEVHQLTAEQRRTIAEAPGLWAAQWTSLEKMKPQDLETVARLLVQAFPSFGPLELTHYFYVLDGKLYDNAEFWVHMAAQHPTYRGHTWTVIKPGTELWDQWIGAKQDPAAIAAAYLCTGKKEHAPPTSPRSDIREQSESNYVSIDDPMLYEFQYVELPEAQTRAQAEQMARAIAAERGLTLDAGYPRRWQQEPWKARYKALKSDAIALAMKKARSTSTRRLLARMFSIGEARVTSTLDHINRLLESKTGRPEREQAPLVELGDGLAIRAAGVPVKALNSAGYDVDDRQTVAFDAAGHPTISNTAAAGPLKAESHHDEAADRAPRLISEADRRKLFAQLDKHDIKSIDADEDPLAALKALIRQAKGLDQVAAVSTKDLTYPEWERVVGLIDALPLLPDDRGSTGGT